MSKNTPKVSVLMPNYNGEKYIRKTIESILNQTYKDFEFIIIDDCSKDNSVEIIKSYTDDRIVLIRNEVNLGLPATLNIGLDAARGEYIARIDSDDICMPTRFEKQVKFMDENPQIGVCGTNSRLIWEDKLTKKFNNKPYDHDRIKAFLINDCSIHHPSVMMRTDVIKKNNLKYNENIKYGEDYEFWTRVIEYTKFAILQEALVQKRTHASQITTAKRQEQLAAANDVRLKMIKKILPDVTEDEFKLHNSLFLREFTPTADFFKSVENWFDKLIKANRQSGFYYTEEALKEVLIGMWLQTLKASGSGILTGLYYFIKAPFSPYIKIRILMEKMWGKPV